ncbi:hypothetical protein [Bordetella genomosp. 11]|uniref:Uncharacterized protein n=1 Tax=Bordetella genomosp. 11 TaxID=1416808 RepID=A0A261UIX9_9BORD|nr:hypothetical protein [Bordetella genomosp. 11]OZI61571.1 hypothetical protein CAL28_20015 [Bordetella genomosp. 11]
MNERTFIPHAVPAARRIGGSYTVLIYAGGTLMSEIRITAKLRCTKCGGDQFVQPPDAKPEDTITCAACGESFVAQELSEVAAREEGKKLAIEHARAAFRDILK